MSDTREKLIRLDEILRKAGFQPGPAQLIESRQLLEELRKHKVDVHLAQHLTDYLGPIYCASEAQQRDFPALLAQAWGDPPRPPDQAPRKPIGTSSSPQWILWLLPLAAVAVVALVTLISLPPPPSPSRPLSGHVDLGSGPCPFCSVRVSPATHRDDLGEAQTDVEGRFSLPVRTSDLPVILTADSPCEGVDPVSTPPIARLDAPLQPLVLKPCPPKPDPNFVSTSRRSGHWQQVLTLHPGIRAPSVIKRQVHFSFLQLLAILSPLFLVPVWWLYWSRLRNAWLTRLPEQTPQGIRELSVGARHSLAGALGWRQMGHELRRREWVDAETLDVDATLVTFLDGDPRLVFGSRVEPEYLALLEESSPEDHLARFGEELLLALEHRDVGLRRYYFADSPARCKGPARPHRPREAGLTSITLDELLARHPDHRLIIVSDGTCLFDLITGQSHPWTVQLAGARQPALLTPIPPARWGRREWALRRLGFTVLPLAAAGVERLSEAYRAEGEPAHAPPAAKAPPRWMAEPISMLLPAPPGRLTTQALRQQLQKDLGEAAYRLVQGAAAYPAIHWGLTTRIGAKVLRNPELAESLPRLAVLPWFRQGYMPQWLRAELIGTQSRESWGQLHHALTSLLETARQGSKGPVPLRIATDTRPYGLQLLSELARHPLQWIRRKPPSPSPLRRDTVFLRFLQGPHRLSVSAGELIRRLLFVGGTWSRGARILPITLLALLAAGAFAWQHPPWVITTTIANGNFPTITALAGPWAFVSEASGQMTIANTHTDTDLRVLAGYSTGQVWVLDASGSSVLPIPRLEKGISGLVYKPDGSIEVTEVGGRVVQVSMPKDWRSSSHSASDPAAVGTSQQVAVRADAFAPYASLAQGGASEQNTLSFTGELHQVVDLPGEWLCVGAAHDHGLVIAVSSAARIGAAAGAQVLTLTRDRYGDNRVVEQQFLASPGVSFDGWRIQESFIVGWRNGSKQGVWRAPIQAAGFTQTLVSAGPPITDALLSDNERSLVLRRGSTIEVYGPEYKLSERLERPLEGQVDARGTLLSASADGLQLAVASGDAVSLWKYAQMHTQIERRALLIGISRYCLGKPACVNNLPGPDNDVLQLRQVLHDRYGFADSEIIVLLDSDAVKPKVLKALADLAAWAAPGREIFIYYSGHATSAQDPDVRVPLPYESAALILAPMHEGPMTLARWKEQLLVGEVEVRPLLLKMDRAGANVIGVIDSVFSQYALGGGGGLGGWPYTHVAWLSASAANEKATDLVEDQTLDGKPHGALTDALLRVLTGQVQAGDGRHVLSYADVFDSTRRYMRSRRYEQTPQIMPSRLLGDPRSAQVLALPAFWRREPGASLVGMAPEQRVVTVNLVGQAASLRSLLAPITGVEITDMDPDYLIKAPSAGPAGQWSLETGRDEPVLTTGRNEPLTQSAEQLRDSLAVRALMRRLAADAQARSTGLILEVGSDDPTIGDTRYAGQKLTLRFRASRDVTVALVQVMGNGQTHIWVPASPAGVCTGDPQVKANTQITLCSWPGAMPPYGLDLFYVIAAEGRSAPLAGITDREVTPSVAKSLEDVVAKHPGQVAIVEYPLFAAGGR
jgi:hypothetical protein